MQRNIRNINKILKLNHVVHLRWFSIARVPFVTITIIFIIIVIFQGQRSEIHVYHVHCFPVVVVVAFFVCWAPFQAQRLVAIYGGAAHGEEHSDASSSTIDPYVYQVLNYVSGILYYLSATINPLLYNLMSYKFRTAFKVSVTESSCSTLMLIKIVRMFALQISNLPLFIFFKHSSDTQTAYDDMFKYDGYDDLWVFTELSIKKW